MTDMDINCHVVCLIKDDSKFVAALTHARMTGDCT